MTPPAYADVSHAPRPALRHRPTLTALGAPTLYALFSVLVTWPLVPCLTTHLPRGRLGEATVPNFNLWTLQWNAQRMLHGYAGYWDAPIFHGARNTFALSEPQPLTGLLFAPLSWLAGDVGGYNLLLLLVLVLNGLAMRHLLRVSELSELAATAGGALALALPFVCQELGVLQLTVLFPPLLVLAEVSGLSRAPSGAGVVRAALALVATVYTCVYYALFLGLLLLPVVASLLFDARVRRVLSPRVVLSAVLRCTAPVAPLLLAQRDAVAGFERPAEVVKKGSASARSYVRLGPDTLPARLLPALAATGTKRSLYPGLTLVALSALGFAAERRGARRRLVHGAALLGAFALLVSFGTRLLPGDFQPYEITVQRFVPGFAQLRSPYRLAVFVQLMLVVLAAVGLEALLRRRAQRPTIAAPALLARLGVPPWPAVALCALALLETVPIGQRLGRFAGERLREPWVDWLATQPRGVVAMVPPALTDKASGYEPTTVAMLQGLRHGHPMVNGYSGFFPEPAKRLRNHLRHFPNQASVRALRAASVRYVVTEDAWVARQPQAAQGLAALRQVFSAQGRTVYTLPSTGPAARVSAKAARTQPAVRGAVPLR